MTVVQQTIDVEKIIYVVEQNIQKQIQLQAQNLTLSNNENYVSTQIEAITNLKIEIEKIKVIIVELQKQIQTESNNVTLTQTLQNYNIELTNNEE